MKDVYEYLIRHTGYYIDIVPNGCWLFTGGSKNGMHGSLYYEGKSWQAHRLAWFLTQGDIPNGLFVLHKCDTGMCINPEHLFLGTQTDNIADMDAKGRSNRPQPGERNGRALLSELDVIEIRRLAKEGCITRASLARKYKTSFRTIDNIIKRLSWRHI